ncbi:MAG: mandelate racemase/muconate lactonizing enzyme family protein [Syntrophales bacterium]|jgi:2-dehydro-3-deoxyphosphogalactonate aldolase|nr:mandelate racemase/muconate lactonizing enzyme family protein [Syntrophales bacterium]MDY0043895.1 mandelate racemase/muconate lactonizing enzyme family protein [Syntrophales bacterium]
MKITGLSTYVVGVPPPFKGGINWIFLKLSTSEGIEGWGECNGAAFREKTLVQLVHELCDHFVIDQVDPFNIEDLWRRLYGGSKCHYWHYFQHPSTLATQACAAIEMACWDIVGKALGQPVYNLLGGKCHEKLRSYTYMMYDWHPGDDPEKAGEAALKIADMGFTGIKLDPLFPMVPQPREISLPELRYAENVFACIRDAVGDTCDILLGTHGQYTTHSAIRLARSLEPYSPLWFEEPIPPENTDELARVASSTSIPIATGERLVTKADFRPILEKQAAQILQINVGSHGLLESKKIAGMAEAYYAQIAPWMYCGPVSGAASIQLDMCSPNFLIQEGIETWGGFSEEILKEPVVWEKGFILPPEAPGLGVEPDEKVLARHPYNEYSSPEVKEYLSRVEGAGKIYNTSYKKS